MPRVLTNPCRDGLPQDQPSCPSQASYRASPDRPAIDILYTGSDATQAQSHTANMIPAFAGASTTSSPNGQDLATAMTTSAITTVTADGPTVYALNKGIAPAVIAQPSLAPFLATVEQTPGALTYQEDKAWTGLSKKNAVGVVTNDCSALVAWAETQVNATTWNGWNYQVRGGDTVPSAVADGRATRRKSGNPPCALRRTKTKGRPTGPRSWMPSTSRALTRPPRSWRPRQASRTAGT